MNDLLTRWQLDRGYEPFFRDGIILDSAWTAAPLKVLFLLKESYGDWFGIDGPINIYSGKNPRFWWNICRWKFLLNEIAEGRDAQEFPVAEMLPEVKYREGRLEDIAYVNVKKSIGSSKSNDKIIQNFAIRDQVFLREQIDEASPEVVLCGGTFWSYHVLYHRLSAFKHLNDKVHYHDGRIIIDFHHPGYFAAKGGEHGLYQKLYDLLDHPSVRSALNDTRKENKTVLATADNVPRSLRSGSHLSAVPHL